MGGKKVTAMVDCLMPTSH